MTGILAILVGWLMILSLRRQSPVPAPAQSWRWVRIALAIVGIRLLTAGLAAEVQARF
jgi:hypothetical protein